MQHVCSVCGVVVGVGGVVADFDELQPGAQRSLCAVQELTHAKSSEDLQPEVGERSAGLQHSVGTYRLLAPAPPANLIRTKKLFLDNGWMDIYVLSYYSFHAHTCI